jgi:acetate---CoA ligase (ADP-forming)
VSRDLRPLFDPRSVAVVGASAQPAKWGYWLARGALRGQHRRSVYLVNRRGDDILGQPCFRSLSDLPDPAELVVIAIGPAAFDSAVDQALAAGARAIVAITAGLGESGVEGRDRERAVVERVRAAGAVLIGPNCLGVADTGTDLDLASQDFAPGSLGLISQSGNLALELALLAQEAGIGFSRFVSVGNQADLGVSELIPALADHDRTRVIALYVEDFRDGRALATQANAAVAAGKPVILLTVGTSPAGARAARSHTGALVSDTAAVDAACLASGMIRVSTPQQLIDLAQALLGPAPLRGRRVAVVGDGGGHVALAADVFSAEGLTLPSLSDALAGSIAADLPATAATRNPVDLAGGGERDFFNYARVVKRLAESGEVDAVVLTGYFGGYSLQSEEFARTETEVAQAMAVAVLDAGRPLIVQTMYRTAPSMGTLRAAGIPVYADIAGAAQAIARLADRAEHLPGGVPSLPMSVAVGVIPDGYFAARELVGAAGIPLTDARRVVTMEEALRAARAQSYPVALKALGLSHKSDSGGVRLGIGDDGQLVAAFTALASTLAPPAFSVERMAPREAGAELLIGVRRDRAFGPIALVGLGGVYTELIRDVAVALAPVTELAALAMIRSLRGAPLLLGIRGRPQLDIQAAARALARLSYFSASRDDIDELEVNPLLVLTEGVLALDARIVVSASPVESSPSPS